MFLYQEVYRRLNFGKFDHPISRHPVWQRQTGAVFTLEVLDLGQMQLGRKLPRRSWPNLNRDRSKRGGVNLAPTPIRPRQGLSV